MYSDLLKAKPPLYGRNETWASLWAALKVLQHQRALFKNGKDRLSVEDVRTLRGAAHQIVELVKDEVGDSITGERAALVFVTAAVFCFARDVVKTEKVPLGWEGMPQDVDLMEIDEEVAGVEQEAVQPALSAAELMQRRLEAARLAVPVEDGQCA